MYIAEQAQGASISSLQAFSEHCTIQTDFYSNSWNCLKLLKKKKKTFRGKKQVDRGLVKRYHQLKTAFIIQYSSLYGVVM